MSDSNLYQTPEAEILGASEQTCEKMELFSRSQRIGRIRYLAYSSGVYFLVVIFAGVLFGLGALAGVDPESGGIVGIIVMGILYIAMIIAFVIVGIRRLHDIDKSGLYYFFMAVPLVNIVFGLYLLFAKGTQGTNSYGPEPLPNHAGTWLAGLVLPVVFTVGVMAAIALPAYQAYIDKVEQSQQN